MHCPVDPRGCVDPEHCQQGGPCEVARRYTSIAAASDPGFTLDDAGRRVNDGWDHDGDLIASFQADLNRHATDTAVLRAAGDELAEAVRPALRTIGMYVGVHARLERALEAWRSAIQDEGDPL